MDAFLDDLDVLREAPHSLPGRRMRLRWRRNWVDVPLLSADKRRTIVSLFLYAANATPKTRPLWKLEIDPVAVIDTIEQGASCEVRGVLQAGRAVAVSVDDQRFVATYPISQPLLGPRLRS